MQLAAFSFVLPTNLSDDVGVSKRAIQRAAEKALKLDFNVICSNGSFSFITHADKYCQASKRNITCYVFSIV
ncbi:unnamed protein product [Gongylonema pulchrum]|uniref:Ground-like domain-containing protein n=1 Tax=Gongylonema pulchrum TaxID=637853 RepID=A0A183EMD2_9BILA|nr:unnamed protein product [Gongylonema pulchrum]